MLRQNNCKICGRLIAQKKTLCLSCITDNKESDFITVRNFLYTNPHSNLTTIVHKTGVSGRKVLGYLREGKLSVRKG